MEWIEEIENEIDRLKDNDLNLTVKKTIARGLICADIIIPQDTFNKELYEDEIEFRLVIDTFSLKLCPKLFCLTPYCFPHLADGRDLYKELRNSKNSNNGISLSNLLSDLLEFIKINYERGGLIFCGNYYLGSRYDLKILQKGCENIINVKENLKINGKNMKFNRVLVLSDVYFLLFQQEKWYKNNLTLLFWSSINNIEKIQKVKDNKTIILHWTTKDKGIYMMNLTLTDRDSFIQDLLEKMKTFGMNFDIMRLNKNNEIEHDIYSSSSKIQNKKGDEKSQSQNVKLMNDKDINEEDEDEEEEEEEDENDEKEKKQKGENIDNNDNNDKDNKENKNNDKENKEKDKNIEDNKNNNIEDEKEEEKKEDLNKENKENKENNKNDKELDDNIKNEEKKVEEE